MYIFLKSHNNVFIPRLYNSFRVLESRKKLKLVDLYSETARVNMEKTFIYAWNKHIYVNLRRKKVENSSDATVGICI